MRTVSVISVCHGNGICCLLAAGKTAINCSNGLNLIYIIRNNISYFKIK